MKMQGIDGMKDMDRFVQAKLDRLSAKELNYQSLFESMFEQEKNIMAERIVKGFRVEQTTYGAAKTAALALAKKLKARLSAVPSGAVVGIGMDNSLEWLEVFWALLACGYKPLLINLRLSDAQLAQAFCDSGAQAVVSDGKTYALPTVMLENLADGAEEAELGEWGTEVYFMTSGTTDRVKLCVYTAENFYHQIAASLSIFQECPQIKSGYEGCLKHLALLPFYHVFGFVAVYLWFGFFARTFVFLQDLAPATLLRTIKKCKVTHIFAVPMVWEAVAKAAKKNVRERGEKTYAKFEKALRFANKNRCIGGAVAKSAFKEVRAGLFGDSICCMISGGSAISQETLALFNGLGYYFVNGYGMTELAITSVCVAQHRDERNLGSIGHPFRGIEYKVGDDKVLYVRTKARACRIISGDKVTVTDYDEWFSTDDVAECRNGEYYLLGRMDDVIISSSGENVNPQSVEDEICIEGVANKALVKGKDGAILVLEIGSWKPVDELKRIEDEAQEILKKVNLATECKRIVLTRDKLVEANEFKVSRKHIAKRLLAGEITPIDLDEKTAAAEWGPLEEELAVILAAALDNGIAVRPGMDIFKDLNATSLDYFAFMSEVLDRYELPQAALEENLFTTVEDVAEFVRKHVEGGKNEG